MMCEREASTLRPRVLMLIPQLGYGGAEGAFLRVAEFLAQSVEVTISLMARDYGNGPYSIADSATELPIVMLDAREVRAANILQKIGRWWRMFRHVRALKKRYDVVISFLSGANLLNALAGSPAKTVVSERGSKQHDTDMDSFQRFLWTRMLDPWIYHRSRYVVAASKGLASEIAAANKHAAERIVAFEGTLHSAQLLKSADAIVEEDFNFLAAYETVIAFGRLHRPKGFDFLVRAFAVVRQRRQMARLLLIGDGPDMADLKALARNLGLRVGVPESKGEADVIFAGYQATPLRYVRIGRLFAFPSRTEGLPNALMEALASGIPILAADCPWGPRSVLAGFAEEVTKESVDLPTPLAYGTLMPLPDHPNAIEIWSEEMVRILEAPVARWPWHKRKEAISRFDIKVTGPLWLALATAAASRAPIVPRVTGQGVE